MTLQRRSARGALGLAAVLLASACGAEPADGTEVDGPGSAPPALTQSALTFDSTCSTSQRNVIEQAKLVMRGMLNGFAPHTSIFDSFYLQWFGEAPGNGGLVFGKLDAINDEYDTWTIRCNTGLCTGADPPHAWTSPGTAPTTVNLCNGWFALDSIQYEAVSNRAGVLLHELTHLHGTLDVSSPACAGDECDDAADARALAAYDGSTAQQSAENYEHFASNFYVAHIMAAQPL